MEHLQKVVQQVAIVRLQLRGTCDILAHSHADWEPG